MRKKGNGIDYFKNIAKMLVIIFLLSITYTVFGGTHLYYEEVLLNETLPFYKINENRSLSDIKGVTVREKIVNNPVETVEDSKEAKEGVKELITYEDSEEVFENSVNNGTSLIGLASVEYKSDEYYNINNHFDSGITKKDIESLKDLNFLKNKFFTVDSRTEIAGDLFNAENFISKDLSIKNDVKGPKVLIFNTHASEIYSDSKGAGEGVVGLGKELASVLSNQYGIEAIYHEGVYDKVDGKTQVLGAYERMEPDIEKVLRDNPSIEVCIDIHRDGVPDNVKLVKDVDGKPAAQFMFVNGICKIIENGKLKDTAGLQNPYVKDNLAFSFQLKLVANELYEGLSRKNYIHAYRYSLNMKPRSILVEIGAQTNTWQEAKNAVNPIAKCIAEILLG